MADTSTAEQSAPGEPDSGTATATDLGRLGPATRRRTEPKGDDVTNASAPTTQASSETAQEPDAAGVIAPPPLIYIGALGSGFVLDALLPSTSVPAAVAWPLGSVLAITGVALARSFFRALHGADTSVSPYSSTTRLVTSGPYRLTRNPGYLGMALGYSGIAVLSGTLWAFLPLALALIVVDRGVIAREERYLERKFGEQYRLYKARTRRWL
jgi:protein-S-isoprenylcysteine O-methyltransferase Ste14